MASLKISTEDILKNIEVAVPRNFESEIIDIHNTLKNSGEVTPIIEHLVELFSEIYQKHKPKPSKSKIDVRTNSNAARFEWHLISRTHFDFFDAHHNFTSDRSLVAQNNFLVLLSLYAYEVFATWSRQKLCDFNEAPQEKELNNSEVAAYERSLLTIGGGCMGEIWKINKKRTIFGKKMHLSDGQRKKAQILWDCALKLRRTTEEKADMTFSGINMRDKGGLFIPKESLNPFLVKLNQLCRDVLNENGFKKYGQDILKIVSNHVKNHEEDLKRCFLSCTKDVLSEDKALVILPELQRKFMHALSNEFITARDEAEKEKKHLSSRGCSGLRDDLYILSQKNKSKLKPFKKQSKTFNGKTCKDNYVKNSDIKIVENGDDPKNSDSKIVENGDDPKNSDSKIVKNGDNLKNSDSKIVINVDDPKNSDSKIVKNGDDLKNSDSKIVINVDDLKSSDSKIVKNGDDLKSSDSKIVINGDDLKSSDSKIVINGDDVEVLLARPRKLPNKKSVKRATSKNTVHAKENQKNTKSKKSSVEALVNDFTKSNKHPKTDHKNDLEGHSSKRIKRVPVHFSSYVL